MEEEGEVTPGEVCGVTPIILSQGVVAQSTMALTSNLVMVMH
jgi:hypothetical protein